MSGKGSRPRPVNKKRYDASYERVFGRCSEHPRYRPTADCVVCRRLWRER